MKWISNLNRQSVLPILFGISLTTFGLSVAILLYNMFEQDDDSDKRKKHNPIATSKRKEISMQIKMPKKYVSAVIGKGGAVIKSIEELTDTHIKMEKEDPFSSERACCISADDIKNIQSARSMISSVINNVPVSESFELFVPYAVSNIVFKRNWREFEQDIQKSYGAKIIVEKDAHKTETGLKRRIILKGTADQIAPAIIKIEDKIQEEIKFQTLLNNQFEVARRSKLSPSNTDVRNTMYDYPDIETYEISVPYQVCGRIIGKGGATVREIEASSGAKISIENTANEIGNIGRKVIVKGITEQINVAIVQIEEKVREANESRIELDQEFTMTIKKITESELSPSNNDTNTSNNILKLSSPTLEQQNEFIEVYVSAMETPSLFWIQVVGPANIDLQRLVSDMTAYYNIEENRTLHTLKKVTAGQMVAAKFNYDSQWYRAEIISVLESSECEVFFVDYGDVDIIPIDDVLELRTDMLSLRVQAVECSLANVKPRESEWSPEANDKFAELAYLAKWKVLVAKVRGYKERPVGDAESRRKGSTILSIDLYERVGDKHINIGDGLIQLGMAQIEEENCSAVNSALSHDKCDLQSIPYLPDGFPLD